MRRFTFSLAVGLLSLALAACSKPPEARPGAEAGKSAKDDQKDPGKDASAGSSEPQPLEDPAWYGVDLIEHEAVSQDSTSETREDGGYSRAILVELAEGTTPKDCIESVKKTLGENLELGEPSEGEDGRLEARGEDGIYKLSVVCGKNKDDKPSAYLGLSVEPG